MTIRALETIRHSGFEYSPGDLIKGLPKDDQQRLLDLKSAETVITAEDVKEVVTESSVDPEIFKELRDALDENYNAEELKRDAKAVGVQFDARDVKEKVIEAIIRQGKSNELLEDDE